MNKITEARDFYNKRINEDSTIGSVQLMEEYAKLKLKDAYLEGFENGWERKEGGVSSFGVSEDLADKYVNR